MGSCNYLYLPLDFWSIAIKIWEMEKDLKRKKSYSGSYWEGDFTVNLALLGHEASSWELYPEPQNNRTPGILGSYAHRFMCIHHCSSVLLQLSAATRIFAFLMLIWESFCIYICLKEIAISKKTSFEPDIVFRAMSLLKTGGIVQFRGTYVVMVGYSSFWKVFFHHKSFEQALSWLFATGVAS